MPNLSENNRYQWLFWSIRKWIFWTTTARKSICCAITFIFRIGWPLVVCRWVVSVEWLCQLCFCWTSRYSPIDGLYFSIGVAVVPGLKNMAAIPWWPCHEQTMIMAKHGHDHAMMTACRPCILPWPPCSMGWSAWFYHDHGMVSAISSWS